MEGGELQDVDISEPSAAAEPSAKPSLGSRVRATMGDAANRAQRVADAINRLRNARNAAIIGGAGVTAVIGRIIGYGWTPTRVDPDGTVIAELPDGTEVSIPSGGTSSMGGMGAGIPQGGVGAQSELPEKKYRTPRKGRWNGIAFKRFTDMAAMQTGFTGLGATSSGQALSMAGAMGGRTVSLLPDPKRARFNI
jgi:hypothetical protein